MEAVELKTQTQNIEKVECDNVNVVLMRYLEILEDEGIIEEENYETEEAIEKYCVDVNDVLCKYLEMLDDDGIIEDYANEEAIEQFNHSRTFYYGGYTIGADDIIDLVDERFLKNQPSEYDFDDYDDYIDAIEERDNELYDMIYDLKVDFYMKLELLRSELEDEAIFNVVDEETGATLYIPPYSKYFDYYYDVVYEYVHFVIVNAFKEASKVYPFIGEF